MERNPDNKQIPYIAERWQTTGEWRMRKDFDILATQIHDEAESIIEDPDPLTGESKEPWITSECVHDLAILCRDYLHYYKTQMNKGGVL